MGHEDAHIGRRSLLTWSENTDAENWTLVGISLFLTVFAGLMSGLTLGLMSLDLTQLEVLKRSGTPKEQRCAQKIMPIIKNNHLLLVTLLLCNAACMEALPLFLDRLADPVTAIVLSVTAVLFFGEIIPQAVCTRYGLLVGARLAWFVRLLMFLCSPIAWPIAKILDWVLGSGHHVLFRRHQLKALVDIHAEEQGLGGKLSADEINVMKGALDLTHKTAYHSMTPLDKVFMLSSEDVLDQAEFDALIHSGHSRVPIHVPGDRTQVVGLVLVKELLQHRLLPQVPVSSLKTRSLPRLPADTPMYDMLKLFQTGRSHMAVLTQPDPAQPRHGLGSHPAAAAAGGHGAGSEGQTTVVVVGHEEEHAHGAGEATLVSPVPPDLAPPFTPIGIITIEDVIEELLKSEIVDETDRFVDNEQLQKVEQALLTAQLPDRLRKLVSFNMRLLNTETSGSLSRLLSTRASLPLGPEEPGCLSQPLLPQPSASHDG